MSKACFSLFDFAFSCPVASSSFSLFSAIFARGGGEYGEEWHSGGTLGNKQNVFDDFTAAARYLAAEGYTTKEELAIMGGSNGGLVRFDGGLVVCSAGRSIISAV